MNFYEHLCSNPQFISLPEEVGEFLLDFIKGKPESASRKDLQSSFQERLLPGAAGWLGSFPAVCLPPGSTSDSAHPS